ncbi:hypothetical protein G7Y89_g8661 [Cudoniella acicularis]|uniref:Uncharacterized protein n=1 Tax=Cudoniella acicularis TaxID=354080 RepID=A0A8H4RIF7_9HELO|nr:hypothetical protein G7Y89_g8661 [Cudoniella acicularis]
MSSIDLTADSDSDSGSTKITMVKHVTGNKRFIDLTCDSDSDSESNTKRKQHSKTIEVMEVEGYLNGLRDEYLKDKLQFHIVDAFREDKKLKVRSKKIYTKIAEEE